jgi:hypothetical protein
LEWQDDVDAAQKPWLTQENYDDDNYYDTSGDTATTYCSDLILDGGGWRLPTIAELETLVDSGEHNPAVADDVFHHISSSYYWSSETRSSNSEYAWIVYFHYGHSDYSIKTGNSNVRCVRGEQSEPSGLSRSGEIVTDSATGLSWQDNVIVATAERTWEDAIDYCENTLALGGHQDWRLPNKNELISIVDYLQYDPALDSGTFQNYYSGYYWCSTTNAKYGNYAWGINFLNGYSRHMGKGNSYHIRCVRGGQIDTSTFNPSIIMYLLN